jgi:hypothetical protein
LKYIISLFSKNEIKEENGPEFTLWETYQWRTKWKEIREKEALEIKEMEKEKEELEN